MTDKDEAPAPDALIARKPKPNAEQWYRLQWIDEAADRIAAQQARIAEQDDKIRQLRIIANVNGDWNIKYGEAVDRAEKAEAALAAALECVKAADAWAYGGEPDTVLEGRYDNVRAKHSEVIDAALAAQEKP